MINGNTQGIRQSLLAQMETMQEMECDRDTFLPEALMFAMSKYTGLLGREISVYLSRSGSILDISVGDSQTVGLPGVNNRRSLTRLCGVRCIHTHPGGNSTLSGVDLQSLQRLKLDAMAAIGVDAEGRAVSVSAAFLDEPDSEGQYKLLLTKPLGVGIITIDDYTPYGDGAYDAAEQLYNELDLGASEDGDGVALLISLDDRDFATYANTVSRFEQQTLARFIREGYFTRHLARERVAYKARRDALAASLRAAFAPDELTLTGLHTGLHLLARLKIAPPDAALRAAAKAQGVALSLLSDYDLTGGEQDFSGTFVLGYGSLSEASFPEAGETLRKVCTAAREASVIV